MAADQTKEFRPAAQTGVSSSAGRCFDLCTRMSRLLLILCMLPPLSYSRAYELPDRLLTGARDIKKQYTSRRHGALERAPCLGSLLAGPTTKFTLTPMKSYALSHGFMFQSCGNKFPGSPNTLLAYYIFSGYPILTKTGFVVPPSRRESQLKYSLAHQNRLQI